MKPTKTLCLQDLLRGYTLFSQGGRDLLIVLPYTPFQGVGCVGCVALLADLVCSLHRFHGGVQDVQYYYLIVYRKITGMNKKIRKIIIPPHILHTLHPLSPVLTVFTWTFRCTSADQINSTDNSMDKGQRLSALLNRHLVWLLDLISCNY